MNEQEYIEQRLQSQIDWYSGRAKRNQQGYRWLRVLEVVLASSIPFFTSLLKEISWMGIVISLMSVSIAILSGLLALYKFQENWIEYRGTAESLKHEKFMFLTRSGPYSVEQPFPVLVERVEAILGKEGASWSGTMRQASAPASRDQAPAAQH
jgi:hypothetical protein